MLEGETTARIGDIASGPGQCRRVVLDQGQLIETEGTAWLYGIESGIVGTGTTASDALLDFFHNLNSQIDFPELHALPYRAESSDAKAEYLSVMRTRMRLAIEPPPDPSEGWDQCVEFYDGKCGLEHNVQRVPLIDVDNLPF